MKKLRYILLFIPLLGWGQDPISIHLTAGWNMIGYVCEEPQDVVSGLSDYFDLIIIAKDQEGMAYLPEWNYNGIGDFQPGFGYQIKLSDAIENFSLCEGTGGNTSALQAELDSLYAYGCMDPLACNYDSNHMYDDNLCAYPELGYDCQGTIAAYVIGMEAEGGIIFYVDESGEHGLVAAANDLGATPWGCQDVSIFNAEEQSIGSGLQNSTDIAALCSETQTAAASTLDFESEGYSDWYLPSFDEIQEMYSSIGPGSPNGNTGNFSNAWYWSSSQADTEIAWSYSFSNGTTFNFYKSSLLQVRAIRAF